MVKHYILWLTTEDPKEPPYTTALSRSFPVGLLLDKAYVSGK